MAMAGAAAAFADHDEQWHLLGDGGCEIETAVEEVLRWTTPAMHSGRTATEDVMVGDRRIRAGEIVSLWNIAADFDEREFSDPERFELGRVPNRHLAFGFGPHFCIGAYLARVEIAAMLTAMRETVVSVESLGTPTRIWSNFLHGFSSMPVRLTARHPISDPSLSAEEARATPSRSAYISSRGG
jgi:cytochrome P450